MTQKTNAEYRVDLHTAIRSGIEAIFTGPADRGVVRSVAAAVLALPAPPVVDFPLIFGLPDAPAIAWLDYDHQGHIALRSGHPGTGSWIYNGKNVLSADLLLLIGDHHVAPMDFRMNRQEAPSTYRK
jgi:hypothetical protein